MKIRATTLPCPECGQALYKPDRSGYHLIHRCSKCGMDYSAEETTTPRTEEKREEDPMRTTLWRVTLVDRRSGEVLYTEMIVAQNEREAAFKVGVDATIREHSVEYDDIEIVFEHITEFYMKDDEKPTRVQIVESAEDPRG